MPAMLDDPTSPPIRKWDDSDQGDQQAAMSQLPAAIQPRALQLRDKHTNVTLLPLGPTDDVPRRLIEHLCELLNEEIRKGDTYPMTNEMDVDTFRAYWFSTFAAVMIAGRVEEVVDLDTLDKGGVDWSKHCMGSFYIKPNYPGRSSHICNGGFLVSNAKRNQGVGKLMGEGYLIWAPKLGYTYSVFNLVYETNNVSIRIWDSLGFKRIGRVKGCGRLRSKPDEYVDALIYGRDLGPDSEDMISEERFDKIKFYLNHQKYPAGADRAEKSRLRSAATHYRIVDGTLMLKEKEVIADSTKQYDIARQIHCQAHGGINKTTATIAEKYHWVRIKETVSLVIKNCPECKENPKTVSTPRNSGLMSSTPSAMSTSAADGTSTPPHPNLTQLRAPQQSVHLEHQQQQFPASVGGTPVLSRRTSMTGTSRMHSQPQQSDPMPIPMSQQSPMPMQSLQQASRQQQHPSLVHQTQMQGHMPQSVIPANINNHMAMAISSAHVTPAGSAVHSPLASGPASTPISNTDRSFDMRSLDPMNHVKPELQRLEVHQGQLAPHELQMSHGQLSSHGMSHAQLAHDMDQGQIGSHQTMREQLHEALTRAELHDPLHSMVNPMDTAMHMQGFGDLDGMAMGDTQLHGMTDNGHLSHDGQQMHMGMDSMLQGQPDGMMGHHDQHSHDFTRSEIDGFNTDGMILDDGNMDLSKPPNLG